ncbi:ubiquitin domain-containing protein [Rutstroemia sp. NJR-2017a BVV2]|nr:ubiquitin domain-containing protein [Rutstroemia sp. NJR-2017a BVV2]
MWTRRELDRERLEFFDTRVSGRAEIWQAINSALSVMWKGGDEGDEDGGVGTAQTILDAVGVTIPQGDLATGGCYDSFGEHYSLPEWVVSDPANILDEEDEGAGKVDDEGEESEELDEEALRRREAKGKAKVKEMVDVRARFQDGIHGDLIFSTGKDDSLKSLIRKITHKLEVRST